MCEGERYRIKESVRGVCSVCSVQCLRSVSYSVRFTSGYSMKNITCRASACVSLLRYTMNVNDIASPPFKPPRRPTPPLTYRPTHHRPTPPLTHCITNRPTHRPSFRPSFPPSHRPSFRLTFRAAKEVIDPAHVPHFRAELQTPKRLRPPLRLCRLPLRLRNGLLNGLLRRIDAIGRDDVSGGHPQMPVDPFKLIKTGKEEGICINLY